LTADDEPRTYADSFEVCVCVCVCVCVELVGHVGHRVPVVRS